MLIETCVLLPGAKALLGFQFAVMLTRPFVVHSTAHAAGVADI